MVAGTVMALAVAAAASYFLVLRPAERDSASISVEDFVDTDVRKGGSSEPAQVGQQVPDVTLEGFDGADVRLRDLTGKPVVINFWASSCAPCVKEMPLIEEAHKALGDEVEFLGVDVFEAESPGRKMIATTGVTYRQTRDPSNELVTQFGGIQLPHTVVLAADGTVSALHNKVLSTPEDLTSLIDAAR